MEEEEHHEEAPRKSLEEALELPKFELLPQVATLLPAVQALASGQLALSPGVAAACLPIIVPFSIPAMSPSAWFSNKRALAYNRCVIVSVYVQGAFAIFKFVTGNMVGGLFDGIQAGMGYYSLTPEGLRFFPTYMMMAGFNGLIGLLQVLQTYNGVPLHFLPLMQLMPPVAALFSAYFGWQFCKELRNIASGLPDEEHGSRNSCFVRAMGGDWWPSFLSSSLYGPEPGPRERDTDNTGGGISGFGDYGGNGQRFSVFEGSGHRLGES